VSDGLCPTQSIHFIIIRSVLLYTTEHNFLKAPDSFTFKKIRKK